jgi:hypothetical protein
LEVLLSTINWSSEKRKISELNPAPYNPRQLTEKQSADLTNSLDKFSLADPIVINANNTIIGGHQRINILKTRGIEEVDVRVPNRLLDEQEERELNLRLNKNLGEFNFDALTEFDKDLLQVVGFTPEELAYYFDVHPFDVGGNESEQNIIKKTFAVCPECGHEFEIKVRKPKKK